MERDPFEPEPAPAGDRRLHVAGAVVLLGAAAVFVGLVLRPTEGEIRKLATVSAGKVLYQISEHTPASPIAAGEHPVGDLGIVGLETRDPWGNPLLFRVDCGSVQPSLEVLSLAADGRKGGEGTAEDIVVTGWLPDGAAICAR
ncbi:MAG: type II secretion system protein GspG [Myxococcota bacterium]